MGRFRYAGRGPRQRHAFNQRTQYGVLLYRFVKKYPEWHLQPTHPVCGASNPKTLLMALYILQPTHPVWGASLGVVCNHGGSSSPSTNAPSMGGLQVFNWLLCGLRLPSTNAPSMGCFARRKKDSFFLRDLQPAHPVWGAS